MKPPASINRFCTNSFTQDFHRTPTPPSLWSPPRPNRSLPDDPRGRGWRKVPKRMTGNYRNQRKNGLKNFKNSGKDECKFKFINVLPPKKWGNVHVFLKVSRKTTWLFCCDQVLNQPPLKAIAVGEKESVMNVADANISPPFSRRF